MFFVIVNRVMKVQTGNVAKFSPRTTNATSWHIAGPFAKRATAERAAVSAMGTHTCLSAQVASVDQLGDMAKDSRDYNRHAEVNRVLRELVPALQA